MQLNLETLYHYVYATPVIVSKDTVYKVLSKYLHVHLFKKKRCDKLCYQLTGKSMDSSYTDAFFKFGAFLSKEPGHLKVKHLYVKYLYDVLKFKALLYLVTVSPELRSQCDFIAMALSADGKSILPSVKERASDAMRRVFLSQEDDLFSNFFGWYISAIQFIYAYWKPQAERHKY